MNTTNNRSRPEHPFVFVDNGSSKSQSAIDIISKPSKPRRRTISKLNHQKRVRSKSKKKISKPKKYFPGEYIYDTKGQMAEIKYIGQCHQGPGTWFGIEFVDGTLGKHNGTFNGHTYFRGEPRRCDMIRGHKIRSKAPPPNKPKKSRAKTHRMRRHKHQRSNSDLSEMQTMSISDLSFNFSDNYFKKHKKRHARHVSQLTRTQILTDTYQNRTQKQPKTIKKEKYKGNKYILAMEEQTEKLKNARIGFIKTEKKMVKKRKHERNSSKVLEIQKRKEFEKEQLSKLNKENRMKELERIHAAKQKSKHKKKKSKHYNRIRSQSDIGNSLLIGRARKSENIKNTFHTPDINKMNRVRSTPQMPLITIEPAMLSETKPIKIIEVSTPLADKDAEFMLTPIPSTTADMMDDNDSMDLPKKEEIVKSYSDGDVYSDMSGGIGMHGMDAMYPINGDSAILLQELSTIDSDECLSPMNSKCMTKSINSVTPRKCKKKVGTVVAMGQLSEKECSECDEIKDRESESEIEGTNFCFPRRCHSVGSKYDCQNSKNGSDMVLFSTITDDKGSDYWIKRYNKMNKTDTKIDTVTAQSEISIIGEPESILCSKSVELSPNIQKSEEESDFSFCGSMSSGNLRQRSQSLRTSSLLKRASSGPIVVNDDQGTDYWIKQYNKANKRKSKSKRRKPKSTKQKKSKLHRSKTVANLSKNTRKTENKNKKSENIPRNIIKDIKPLILPQLTYNNSPFFQSDASDTNTEISDGLLTVTSTLSSTVSNDPSFESLANSSVISSLISSNPSSAESTPNTNDININFNIDINLKIANAKYGIYPFKRRKEQYINRKFTGIVRSGHRYLLRDGRVGIVRYVNNTRFAPGIWIGFELDKSEGEHNGSVNGIQYFECQHTYGTFVKKSQIAQYIGRDNTKSLSKSHLRRLNIVQKY